MVCPSDVRGLSREKKDKILKDYGFTCAYCTDDATEVDHIIPFMYSHNDSEDNLVASCHFCNALANDKYFDDFASKREYLMNCKYRFFVKKPVPVWIKDELNELGYVLRSRIEPRVVIVDDEDMAMRVIRGLGEQGFTAYRKKFGVQRRAS